MTGYFRDGYCRARSLRLQAAEEDEGQALLRRPTCPAWIEEGQNTFTVSGLLCLFVACYQRRIESPTHTTVISAVHPRILVVVQNKALTLIDCTRTYAFGHPFI